MENWDEPWNKGGIRAFGRWCDFSEVFEVFGTPHLGPGFTERTQRLNERRKKALDVLPTLKSNHGCPTVPYSMYPQPNVLFKGMAWGDGRINNTLDVAIEYG